MKTIKRYPKSVLLTSLLIFSGCIPESSYQDTSYSYSPNSGGFSTAPSAHPSGTPVPTPEREDRFPVFDNFVGVSNINGSEWFCLTVRLEHGSTYSSCSRENRFCERVRSDFIDRGEDVSRCANTSEAWCFALTDGISNNRMAMCELTYDDCASARDALVRGNRTRVYPHHNITRCRAFR